MKELLGLIEISDLILGMKTELGYTTKRCTLKTIQECEDWLGDPENSIDFITETENSEKRVSFQFKKTIK